LKVYLMKKDFFGPTDDFVQQCSAKKVDAFIIRNQFFIACLLRFRRLEPEVFQNERQFFM